jgi:hypothetical protein
MNRLRRQAGQSSQFPVAAEVLEHRSLLSATVHAAVAHAQHDIHSAAKQAAPVVVFPQTYDASVALNGTIQGQPVALQGEHFGGTFHGASAVALAGKTLKIGINEPAVNVGSGGTTLNSIKGTIQGKVLSFNDIGSGKHELVIATSGHLAVTLAAGGQTFKTTLSADPENHAKLDVIGDGTSLSPYELVQLGTAYLVTKPKGAIGAASFTFAPEPH